MFLEEGEVQQVVDALVGRLRSGKKVGRWVANGSYLGCSSPGWVGGH